MGQLYKFPLSSSKICFSLSNPVLSRLLMFLQLFNFFILGFELYPLLDTMSDEHLLMEVAIKPTFSQKKIETSIYHLRFSFYSFSPFICILSYIGGYLLCFCF